jgi:CxxC motif-containing protein (DUF1111 family)
MVTSRKWFLPLASVLAIPLVLVLGSTSQNQFGSATEAPTGFADQTNGFVDQATHDENRLEFFSEIDTEAEGLGPLFNEKSCANCHSGPTVGGGSNTVELRVGHTDRFGNFVNPTIRINHGRDVIKNRSLINQFAICDAARETVPSSETIHALRLSVSVLGDGFVEAIDDSTLLAIAQRQAQSSDPVRGQAIKVPVLEAPGATRVGRFGWKDQHGSLLSFAADAYLNEQGITSRLLAAEVTSVCDKVVDPEDDDDSTGTADIDHFAQFMRSTTAPPNDPVIAASSDAKAGANLFDQIGCSTCHVRTIKTAATGTRINGGQFTVPAALGDKLIHPYGDYLLHDIGTGDGIVQNGGQSTAHKLRTVPLWGLRTRTNLMHDGLSTTRNDAILRHRNEARNSTFRYKNLTNTERAQLLKFLSSL